MGRTRLEIPKAVVRKGNNAKVRKTQVHESQRPRYEPTVAEGLAEALAEEDERKDQEPEYDDCEPWPW